MSHPLLYIDESEVREGAEEELKEAIAELADFIEANEPQILSYNAYLSDDGRTMNVVHLHDGADSLDRHFEIAGSKFERFKDLISLRSIRVFGDPSEAARKELREKADTLGSGGGVEIRGWEAGFNRIALRD